MVPELWHQYNSNMAGGNVKFSHSYLGLTTGKMTAKKKSAAGIARHLLRSASKAVLSTHGHQGENNKIGPLGSLVTFATSWDGSPILMLSTLAQHTQNLLGNAQASLFVDGTEGFLNPQQGPRVCVMGCIMPLKEKKEHRRFLARHPRASLYASFGDFQFYKMKVERYHYVGGFAKALWIGRKKAILSRENWVNIAASEENILEHMNLSHQEALRLYGTKLLGQRGKHWRMIGLDPEGIDLRCGNSNHRLEFGELIIDAKECRKTLISLAAKARRS